jgi:nucleotidyltransferase substrate binding protein (TIGR01987 family)
MERMMVIQKNIVAALKRLDEAITYIQHDEQQALPFINAEQFHEVLRDSLIQRFEFCVELFWKYLKHILEYSGKNNLSIIAPKPVIRAGCNAKLFSEKEASCLLEMIDARNKTSHLYKKEVAENLAQDIPQYHQLMKSIVDRLSRLNLVQPTKN